MALLTLSDNRAMDGNGQPVAHAKRFVYRSGSDELSVLFSDEHLTEMTANPTQADENGVFQNCYLHAGQYRVDIVNARGNPVISVAELVVTEAEKGFVRRYNDVSELLADTSLSYSAVRAKLRVSVGQIIDVADGNFTYVILPENSTIVHLMTAGGVKLELMTGADAINVRAFGALGDGVTDDTAALQAAINAASHLSTYDLTIPAGRYIFDTLYMFHDAQENPGFDAGSNPNRQGRIRLKGHGTLDISNVRSYAPSYGTILESTGDGVVVASAARGHGSNPYPSRKFEAEDITFVANKAGGYVIEAAACPLIHLHNCIVYQRHVNGHGLYAKSSWFADFDRTRFFGVPGSTGTGIVAGTEIFGGLYTFRNCQIDTWRDGFDWREGSFSNVAFRDTAIQNCTRNGIFGSGGEMYHCSLTNVYFEGENRQSDIRGLGTVFRHLKIDQMFVLAGSSIGTSYLSGPVINLESVSSLDISGVHATRLTRTFCNVDATDNFGASSGSVSHLKFTNDTAYAGATVFLFTGVLPAFGEGIVWPGFDLGYTNPSAPIRLFDPSVAFPTTLVDRRTGTTSISSLALGDVAEFPGQGTVLIISPSEKRSLIKVGVGTGVGISIRLPNQGYVLNGRTFMVASASDSIGILVVRNNSDNSEVLTLRPGQACLVSLNAVTGKYVRFMADLIMPQPKIDALVNSSGGTSGATVGAISGSGADAAINNNFATLAVQMNAVLTKLQATGLLT